MWYVIYIMKLDIIMKYFPKLTENYEKSLIDRDIFKKIFIFLSNFS
jgi:hypothetical protein